MDGYTLWIAVAKLLAEASKPSTTTVDDDDDDTVVSPLRALRTEVERPWLRQETNCYKKLMRCYGDMSKRIQHQMLWCSELLDFMCWIHEFAREEL